MHINWAFGEAERANHFAFFNYHEKESRSSTCCGGIKVLPSENVRFMSQVELHYPPEPIEGLPVPVGVLGHFHGAGL